MTNVNAMNSAAHSPSARRKGWKRGGGAIALIVIWLAMLGVPMVGLLNVDAFASVPADDPPKPWMPIYPPII